MTPHSAVDRSGVAVVYIPQLHDSTIRVQFNAEDSRAAWELGLFVLRCYEIAAERRAKPRVVKRLPSRDEIVGETNFLRPLLEPELTKLFNGVVPLFYERKSITFLLPLPMHVVGQSLEVRNTLAEDLFEMLVGFFPGAGTADPPTQLLAVPFFVYSAELPLC